MAVRGAGAPPAALPSLLLVLCLGLSMQGATALAITAKVDEGVAHLLHPATPCLSARVLGLPPPLPLHTLDCLAGPPELPPQCPLPIACVQSPSCIAFVSLCMTPAW